MANSSHKPRQQKTNVAARKKKVKETAISTQLAAEINRNLRSVRYAHLDIRRYCSIIDRPMITSTIPSREAMMRPIVPYYGGKYRP